MKQSNVLMLSHLEQLLTVTTASAYCKDKEGRYLECNQSLINVAGLSSYDDIINRTDNDFIWKDYANLMITNDKEIIKICLWFNIVLMRFIR